MADVHRRQGDKKERPLSAEDICGIENAISYINDHYAFNIPLERLASIACMSVSKFKTCFKTQSPSTFRHGA